MGFELRKNKGKGKVPQGQVHMLQQNGRAERFNRTILEKAEAMHHHVHLPKVFWQYAVEKSVHLYNRQPMCHHDWKTLIQPFKGDGKKPDASYF